MRSMWRFIFWLLGRFLGLSAGRCCRGRRSSSELCRRRADAAEGPRSNCRVATPLAFAAALLWAVHPLQTGAVTYIIQRTESLVGLFYLLTIYCVVRGATSAWRAAAWYLAALLSCAGNGVERSDGHSPARRTALRSDIPGWLVPRGHRPPLGLVSGMAASWGIVAWGLLVTNFHGGSTATSDGLFTRWTYLLTQSRC